MANTYKISNMEIINNARLLEQDINEFIEDNRSDIEERMIDKDIIELYELNRDFVALIVNSNIDENIETRFHQMFDLLKIKNYLDLCREKVKAVAGYMAVNQIEGAKKCAKDIANKIISNTKLELANWDHTRDNPTPLEDLFQNLNDITLKHTGWKNVEIDWDSEKNILTLNYDSRKVYVVLEYSSTGKIIEHQGRMNDLGFNPYELKELIDQVELKKR